MFNGAAPFHFTRYAKQSCLFSASWAKNAAVFLSIRFSSGQYFLYERFTDRTTDSSDIFYYFTLISRDRQERFSVFPGIPPDLQSLPDLPAEYVPPPVWLWDFPAGPG